MISHEFLSEIPPIRSTSKTAYAEELSVMQQLLESDSIAVKFSYPTRQKATSAREVLKNHINKRRWQLIASQRETNVYIIKK